MECQFQYPITKYNFHTYPFKMFSLLLSMIYWIFPPSPKLLRSFTVFRKNAMLSQQNNTDVITLLSQTERQIKTPCPSLSHYTVTNQMLDVMSFSSLTMLFGIQSTLWNNSLKTVLLLNIVKVTSAEENSKSILAIQQNYHKICCL